MHRAATCRRNATLAAIATFSALTLAGTHAHAACSGNGQPVSWPAWHGVTITACIHDPGLGFQSVSWGVENQSGTRVNVSFVKVYRLTCGNEITKNANLIGIKPGQFVGGGNFSGDLDLNDAFFKEDCAAARRVQSISYKDLRVETVRPR
jgi:hypothetical protein